MSRYVFKMPDLGEGTVAAEIVACHVKVGDVVKEEQAILEVMTEKASVEVNSPVGGQVVWIGGAPGDSLQVGADLIVFETADAAGNEIDDEATRAEPNLLEAGEKVPIVPSDRRRIMASPATRRRARDANVDLSLVSGTGPRGRIERADLDRYLSSTEHPATVVPDGSGTTAAPAQDEVEEISIVGMRRVIAQRMTEAMRTIPHFSYVEEIDVTELEALRRHMNSQLGRDVATLTYLPFLALSLARVLPQHPQCNARYDSEREKLLRHRALHLGIATQTPSGLKVPVVRNVAQYSIHALANEIRRVSEAARINKASREELSGSTLTVTSLGKLGGIATTPIINSPEVSIIGVNRAFERPVVRQGTIVVRRMMNISASFDHRFVDGHDAASLVQALKDVLEHPALIFMPQQDRLSAAAARRDL